MLDGCMAAILAMNMGMAVVFDARSTHVIPPEILPRGRAFLFYNNDARIAGLGQTTAVLDRTGRLRDNNVRRTY